MSFKEPFHNLIPFSVFCQVDIYFSYECFEPFSRRIHLKLEICFVFVWLCFYHSCFLRWNTFCWLLLLLLLAQGGENGFSDQQKPLSRWSLPGNTRCDAWIMVEPYRSQLGSTLRAWGNPKLRDKAPYDSLAVYYGEGQKAPQKTPYSGRYLNSYQPQTLFHPKSCCL